MIRMDTKKTLLLALTLLAVTGISVVVLPVHAAPTWPLLLDANSTGPTDANPQATNTVVKTFVLGIIIEANSTTPLNGVFGWQVGIIYDNTTVVPQGDPVAASASDGSGPTVNFGAQTTTGNVNWAGLIAAQKAFGGSTLVDPRIDNHHNEIQVFLTILNPNPAVNISPVASLTVKGNVLANVAFELIKPATALSFTIASDFKIVDSTATPIPGIVAGPPVSVTITNSPPTASFTATPLPNNDPSCTAVTGAPCSPFAFTFDGSASSDSDGSIASPAGYFWDFGDGFQDNANNLGCGLLLCNQGPVAIHDFSISGTFSVTLRVVDLQLATGSARDSLDSVIVNNQPSHTLRTVTFVTVHTTTATVSCSTPVAVNQASSCTATVTDTNVSPSAPTGTVSFTSDGTGTFATSPCTLGTPTTNSASCSALYTPTVVGTGSHVVTGSYGGDSAHTVSSGTATVTVTKRTTTTAVSCTPTSDPVNAPTTCTATVTDTSPGTTSAPTGTVAFTSSGTGAFTGSPCTLGTPTANSASCSATYTPTVIGTGSHMITSSYGSDATHAISSGTATVTVTTRATTTSVNCNPSSVTVNSPTTCTATVTDTSPGTTSAPTGTVTFTSSGTGTVVGSPCTLGTPAANSASCSVTYTPTVAGTGIHTITSNYGGDATHAVSSGTATVTVTPRTTTTGVSCTPSTVAVNQPTTCTATVTDISGGTASAPTGTVTFTSTGTGTFTGSPCTLGSPTANSASCSVTYNPTVIGTGSHVVTGSYGGDPTHAVSSGTATVTVTKRNTTTAVSCTPASVPVNAPTTCTATVTDSSPGTASAPTGTVTFTSSGTGTFTGSPCTLGTLTANSAGCSATYTPTVIGTGSHVVTGSYGGDTNHNTSSGTATVTVTTRTTTTSVTCSPNSVNTGQATTCTATVTDVSAGTTSAPTGTATFTSSGTGTFTGSPCSLGTPTANSASCSVTYTPTAVGTGTHTITGSYSGDATHAISSGQFALAVGLHPTTTTVSCTPSSVVVNQPTTCTATVTDTSSSGATAPTGTVTFTSSGTGTFTGSPCTLGTPTANSASCSATYNPTVIGTGSHTITGSYGGDSTHATSSGPFGLTVTAPALHTTTTVVSCTTPVVVNQGSTCTATVTDTDASPTSPTGTVTFTATGSAAGSLSSNTCTLSGPTANSATCQVTFLPSSFGTANIAASYGGDSTHAGSSTTTAFVITVNKRTTSTSITCDTPVTVNTPSSCNVTVTDTSTAGNPITPTGTFALTSTSTGTFSGPCNLSGSTSSASCTLTYTPTVAGGHTITANYPGDNSHGVSSGAADISATAGNVHPVASFTETSGTALTQVSISFDASASNDPDGGTIVSYAWDFGDGNTATGVTTSHAYAAAGSYTVTLIVTDSDGGATGKATSTKTIQDRPPVAGFTESTTQAPTGTTISFDASASSDIDGTVVNYSWNFGDATTGTGKTTTHSYAKAGTYTVTLTVTDNSGSTDQATSTKTIADRPPVAAFTFTPTSPSVGQTVNFDASSSADPDGTITNYAWDFGDSTTGSGVTTSHVYTTTGSFTVTLTVTDDNGNTGSATATVTVTSQQAGAHADLTRIKVQFRKFSITRQGPTEPFFADTVNNGNLTEWVYTQFTITSDSGVNLIMYTQERQLTPGESINGNDPTFQATFNPTVPGSYTVVATVFYSPSATMPPVGDPSFTPSLTSTKTLSFTVIP